MTRKLSALLVALFLVLGACGDDEVATPGGDGSAETSEPDPGTGDEMPEPVCLDTNFEGLPEYRGITPDQAHEKAEAEGLTVREVGRDGECFAVTDDLRTDRLNIEIVANMVVGAAIY